MKKLSALIGALLLFTGLKAQDTPKVKKATNPQVKTNKVVKTTQPTQAQKLHKTAFPKTTDSVQSKMIKHTPAIKK